MLASSARISCRNAVSPAAHHSRSAQTFKAFYATIRSLRQTYEPPEPDDVEPSEKDFILSLLRANPSLRDTKSYLASFGPRPHPPKLPGPCTDQVPIVAEQDTDAAAVTKPPDIKLSPSPVVASILNPVHRRTALVKIQAPFTDRQLESIARGMVYLEKLGLVSVIVVENDQLPLGESGERTALLEETMRVVNALEKQGARARPVLGAVVRLGPKPEDEASSDPREYTIPEAHTYPSDLVHIRSALRAGEIPVLAPLALDSFCRSVRVNANDVIAALVRGMVEAAAHDSIPAVREDNPSMAPDGVDLTPLRLMIITREGGVPSYARQGMPHLLINLTSEYQYIRDTFDPRWKVAHPTALANLNLARNCLAFMPPTSSAVMVSHRSPSSLIGNLITNKPAFSSSLPHALLQGNRKLTPHTPTLLRRGLPIRVVRTVSEIDKEKMKALLEQSFRRELEEDAFWERMERDLDFVIVAGDYAGAAIVTREPCSPGTPQAIAPITYLDKFAVLPKHQGDGTVDFLWVALHDETYGLGLPFSANPNGGKEGKGEGRDLVWRSRADNPVNKWYFERSTGHMRQGDWVLFWCDAEVRLKTEEGRRANAGLSYLEEWEVGRLSTWSDVVMKIPSSWKPKKQLTNA
ncbi:mitochondrial amino-acid acetyltransferase [Earliella scabrosa]|nr:mitochondrial amino-acid acetyltransferase [Earliella scabrosa]